MRVSLPVTRTEEIDIPDEVIFQCIKDKFKQKYPRFHFDSYIDTNGNLKFPTSFDGYGYSYQSQKATLEDITLHNLWEQISEIYRPEYK